MNQLTLADFSLPRYQEIPDVGLYLKQIVTFINRSTEAILSFRVTPTMLSNYVKLHLVSNPVKKMYSREQIASLLFIVLAKNVISLDQIRTLLSMQPEESDLKENYDYFCNSFENELKSIFSSGTTVPAHRQEDSPQKHLLNQVIRLLAQKIYLDKCFENYHSS